MINVSIPAATHPVVHAQSRGTTYSRTFGAALDGQSAWSREARAVVTLAARMGQMLDEQDLIVSDVRDLQAMRARLMRQFR